MTKVYYRGTPDGYRFMNGYGSHTFSLVNKDNERFYVKFHYKTMQGHKTFKWNPFDLTKVWPHSEFPLIDVGEIELNEIPENYFQDVEQAAFAPANLVDGIGFSPDKMLQGRILAYPDAHRYRIGANYDALPVNKCPYSTNNYHCDGAMRFDGNGGSTPNYYPNSFDGMQEDRKGQPYELESNVVSYFDRNDSASNRNEDDHFTQPGILFDTVMNQQEQQNTISNIVGAMRGISGSKKNEIINRQLCHWFRASAQLGMGIAKGLDVDVDEIMKDLKH